MPLTTLQKDVLALLAANRSPESHFAGGIVLNAADASPRFSHDLDIFHDVAEEVARASQTDVQTLRRGGFFVDLIAGPEEWGKRETTFRKARVSRAGETVEIDWAADSAFRFFPVEPDPVLGFRLHLFDVATNKALTLSARTETRDYVDILELQKLFPLAAICWAACGKDPGFTPLFLLKYMRRFAKIDPAKLKEIQAKKLDPVVLKSVWMESSEAAEAKMKSVADAKPDLPIGVAFVDESSKPGWIGDNPSLKIHAATVRGCWPSVSGLDS